MDTAKTKLGTRRDLPHPVHKGRRFVERLTDLKAKRLTVRTRNRDGVEQNIPSRHADGAGLFLYVSATGAKSWVFVYVRDGKKKELGLGAYPETSIADARKKAKEYRESLRGGKDPKAVKEAATAPRMTFSQAYDAWYAWKRGTWRPATANRTKNPFHRPGWQVIGAKPVSEVTPEDLVTLLLPLPIPTRDPMRRWFANVFDFAISEGWRESGGLNPAAWRGLFTKFPQEEHVTNHLHPVGLDRLHAWLRDLRSSTTINRLAVECCLLTGSRYRTVTLATWAEVDFEAGLWQRPAFHMKSKRKNEPDRVHVVPITPRLMEIFKFLHGLNPQAKRIFPKGFNEGQIKNKDMNAFMPEWANLHGLRTDFKQWSRRVARPLPERDAVEYQLDHKIANLTELSYLQDEDFMAERWDIMRRWEEYLGEAPDLVALDPVVRQRKPHSRPRRNITTYNREYMRRYRAAKTGAARS